MIFIIFHGMPCFSSYMQKHTKLWIDGKLRLKHKTKQKTVKPFYFTQFGNMLASLSFTESSLHNGAINEIKEIKVFKKCPKVKPFLIQLCSIGRVLVKQKNYVQTFFGWCKISQILCQTFLFANKVKYWVYFLDLSVKKPEGLVR